MPLETSAAAGKEAAYRIAFDAAPLAMALISDDGCLRDVNRKWTEITGRSRSELIDLPLRDLLPPEDRADLVEWISAPFEKKDVAHRHYRIVKSFGESAVIRLSLRNLSEEAHLDHSYLVTIAPAPPGSRAHDHEVLKEITHRVRNLVTIIQVMARHFARQSATPEEFEAEFSSRLASMMTTANVLAEGGWSGADLSVLVKRQLRTYAPTGGASVNVAGPTILLSSLAAQNVGMAIHELADNAIKFGAWSVLAGKVDITWRRYADQPGLERMELLWRESGGPTAVSPFRSEFGRRVCEDMVSYALSAQAAISFESGALVWRLDAPCSVIDFTPPRLEKAQF